VHRSLSPSKILIGYDGQVKLLGLGIAAALAGSGRGYRAPEEARGEPGGPSADLYALAAVLAEAIHAASRPAPERVEQLLRRAMAPEPAQRHADGSELERDLLACARELGSRIDRAALGERVRQLFGEPTVWSASDAAAPEDVSYLEVSVIQPSAVEEARPATAVEPAPSAAAPLAPRPARSARNTIALVVTLAIAALVILLLSKGRP
jgi:serine/threonine protein kinase